jgi:anthranilate synthase component 1
MYYPFEERFLEMADAYSIIPVCKEIRADTETPISLFMKLGLKAPSFLLESVEGGQRWGRYSYIGLEPSAIFMSKGEKITIIKDGKKEIITSPFSLAMRGFLNRQEVANHKDLPGFSGGAVGYIGYDFVRNIEKLPELLPDDLGLPDSYFMIPDILIIFDNLRHTIRVQVLSHLGKTMNRREAYKNSIEKIERVLQLIERKGLKHERLKLSGWKPNFSSRLTREEFSRRVERIREAIHEGEAIQVVFSNRIESPFPGEPFELYRELRQLNPSPYLFYLNMPECVLLGASPELLVRLEGGLIDLRPIAGTRPRGNDAEEERRLEVELLSDQKERAEHVMLVDLGRNDIGRVSEPGSVIVREFMTIEKYSHVMHIVSHIQGRLQKGKDSIDLLEACFPAGTVTGAPKVRAMEIIEEMETQRRGPYAGAVGYFSFTGEMELCITIRSILVHKKRAYIQVGAGIVADSNPEKEYDETIYKAGAMIRAIEMVGRRG